MGVKIEDLARAGLSESADGKTLKRKNERAIDLRPASTEAGKFDLHADDTGAAAKLERHTGHGAVAALRLQEKAGKHFLIRVTAIRTRLLDDDNACEKYHIDLLRYASGGALGDSPATTRIEVRQEKVEAGAREEVRLEVFEV